MEWDTFVRHKIPIIGIIGNNSIWGQVAKEQLEIFDDSTGINLGERSHEKVVEGFVLKDLRLKRIQVLQ